MNATLKDVTKKPEPTEGVLPCQVTNLVVPDAYGKSMG